MATKWDSAAIAKARAMLGDVDDNKFTAILELEPNLEEIEEAVLQIEGLGGVHRHGEWPLKGKVGLIVDILASELGDESRSH